MYQNEFLILKKSVVLSNIRKNIKVLISENHLLQLDIHFFLSKIHFLIPIIKCHIDIKN